MPRPPKGIEGRALLWRWMATEPPCSRWTSWGKRHGETLRSAAQMRRLRRLHGAARVESPRGRPAFARCSGPSRVPLRHPRGDSRHRVRSRSLHRQGAAGGVAVPVLHRAEAAVGPRRSATRLPGVSEPVGPPRLHLSIMRAIAGALVRVRSVRRMLREPRLGLVPASGLYGGASRRGAWATDGTVLVLLQHQRLPDRRTAWWPIRSGVAAAAWCSDPEPPQDRRVRGWRAYAAASQRRMAVRESLYCPSVVFKRCPNRMPRASTDRAQRGRAVPDMRWRCPLC